MKKKNVTPENHVESPYERPWKHKVTGGFAKGTKPGPGWKGAQGKFERAALKLRAAMAELIDKAISDGDHEKAAEFLYKKGDGLGFIKLLRELDARGILPAMLAASSSDKEGQLPQRIVVQSTPAIPLEGIDIDTST